MQPVPGTDQLPHLLEFTLSLHRPYAEEGTSDTPACLKKRNFGIYNTHRGTAP